MLYGSLFYCARATILGHISPISGVPSCLPAAGLRLLVIVEAFGMLYWGIFPFWAFLSKLRDEFRGKLTFLRLDIHID